MQFPTPTPSPAAELARIFLRKLHDSTSYMFVAENEAGLVGYVSGYRHAAFYAGGDTAWVDEVLVEETCRNRGIGGLLMAAFEQRVGADGCKLVSLSTAGAAAFYSKLGYQTKASYYKKYLISAEQTVVG